MSDTACILIDNGARVEVRRGTEAWQASMDWARFHGLDPNRIPAGAEIVRDVAGRRILYSEFVKNGPNVGDILMRDGEPVIVERIEQGEAPPLPFPPEVFA